MLYVPIQLLSTSAIVPTKTYDTDAAYDLHSDDDVIVGPHETFRIKTGIAMAIPPGYFGHILPRSGLAVRYGLQVLGGVIDSGYRGELILILQHSHTKADKVGFFRGQKVAQIVIHRCNEVAWNIADRLPAAPRSANGFGSSDKS